MKTSIKSLLPSGKHLKKVNFQARVDASLAAEVRKIMAKHSLSCPEVVTACLKTFVQEMSK